MTSDSAQTTAIIDGLHVQVLPGETVLDAARRFGIDIPTLCNDPRVGSSGACRLCMVKLEGRRQPVPACSQPLEAGMAITTHDPDLEDWRKTILKLALSENPADECPRCQQIGPCELHAMADAYGVTQSAYHGATSGQLAVDDNPFILRDYSQCIYCYRCVSVCNDFEQAHAIMPVGRGFMTEIAAAGSDGLLSSPCTFCGQCVQACPTGALMDRKRMGKAKAEEVERVRTTCPYCGTGCGIELNVAHGEVVGVTPDWGAPANEGALCVKGQFGMDFIHSSDRLTTPLIRRNGTFEEASWDEALNLVAEKFNQIKAESGPDAFTLWSSSRSTNEANYMVQKLARAVIGTNNVDNCART